MLSRLVCLIALALPLSPTPAPAPAATALVDTAIARMGGRESLEKIQRIRRDMLTQWVRVNFDDRPFTDGPSYEMHADVRDYTLPGWRNTRKFVGGGPTVEIVDIVRDSVGVRSIGGKWQPLNVAYVDERRELFDFAPERILLLARMAGDLRLLPDSMIAGILHARVSATIDSFPTVLFFRRGDGMLAAAHFRAGHPNDFGLAPWGVMPVEIWYSRWQLHPQGVVLPNQWDTRRVGRTYKRITVLTTTFDSVAPVDSFVVSDSLRTVFNATSRRPMHDQPLDSARVLEDRFASFGTVGAPVGAIRFGTEWWLLESGQAPFNADRAVQWLEHQHPGSRVTSAIISVPASSNGGIAWLAQHQRVIRSSSRFQPIGNTILRDHQQPVSALTIVDRGQWQRVGQDSVWLEPVDYPDMQSSLYLYIPSLKYAYSAGAAAPLQLEFLMRKLKERGFVVDRVGTARGVLMAVPK